MPTPPAVRNDDGDVLDALRRAVKQHLGPDGLINPGVLGLG